jgi:hypothetical protein
VKFPVPPWQSRTAIETDAAMVQVCDDPPSKIAVSPVDGGPNPPGPPEMVFDQFVVPKLAPDVATQ